MRIQIIMAVALLYGYAAPYKALGDFRLVPDYAIRHISTQKKPVDSFVAQQVSNRCLTPYFWCFLPGYAPVGTACWCASPNGPVAGYVG
ncbi:MAG TPA: hypothetical protein VFA74_19555 [Terriglobales bacterium]|nr:hypothetical protein [Terriglobales bacterium]